MRKKVSSLLSLFLGIGMTLGFSNFGVAEVSNVTDATVGVETKVVKQESKQSEGQSFERAKKEEVKREEDDKVILKFKRTPLKEVLNALANAFDFYYVIHYPNFEFWSGEEFKEVVYQSVLGQTSEAPVPSQVTQPVQQSSDSDKSEDAEGQVSPFKSGSNFENRLITFYVAEDKRNVEKVIDLFCAAADVKCEYDGQKRLLKVVPYVVQVFDYGFFMDYSINNYLGLGETGAGYASTSFTSTFTGATGVTGGTTGSAGGIGGSSTGTSFFVSETYKEFVYKILSGFRSSEGKMFVSNRGYIVVVDRPSAIERIKEVWEKEVKKQEPVVLNVKVVRVDLKKSRETGIDWNGVINKALGADNTRWSFSANFAGTITKGLSFTYDSSKLDALLKMLQEYGEVRIVYDWTVKARNGIPVVFADTQSVPYLTQTVVVGGETSQVSTTPAFVDVGLKINTLGSFTKKCEEKRQTCLKKYEGQVFVSISDLIKIENLGTAQSPYFVPNVKFSSASIPFELKSNESIVITSFKTTKKEKVGEGVPLLMNIPLFGGLFKYDKDYSGVSEFVIIVTPAFEESVIGVPEVIYKKKS